MTADQIDSPTEPYAFKRPTISIPADHDADTIRAAATEIDSLLTDNDQTDHLDDRTRESLVIALEVLRDAATAYDARA